MPTPRSASSAAASIRNVAGSYWELAADQHLNTFADMRTRVGSNTAGLFVLAR